jgi:hypothetical protein
MGIGADLVEPLIREHLYRPITGDVVTIGRQSIYFTPTDILALLREHGVPIDGIDPTSIELDENTIDRLPGFESRVLISDRALFRFFGISNLHALDVSSYERADIIHDLSLPITPALREIADFVIDGSTLDNTFDPARTLKNYAALLRPGGRLLSLNAFSSWDTPYCIMPPLWYLDYFVMNGFADCKAYVVAFVSDNKKNVFWHDVDFLYTERRRMGRFVSPYHMFSVIFAEKAATSTVDRVPIQQDYRSTEDWVIFLQNLDAIRHSSRPHLLRSTAELAVPGVQGGLLLIDQDYNPVR